MRDLQLRLATSAPARAPVQTNYWIGKMLSSLSIGSGSCLTHPHHIRSRSLCIHRQLCIQTDKRMSQFWGSPSTVRPIRSNLNRRPSGSHLHRRWFQIPSSYRIGKSLVKTCGLRPGTIARDKPVVGTVSIVRIEIDPCISSITRRQLINLTKDAKLIPAKSCIRSAVVT